LRVAVIGAGKMGRWFTKLFFEEGFISVHGKQFQSSGKFHPPTKDKNKMEKCVIIRYFSTG